jgi:hypothetical protein
MAALSATTPTNSGTAVTAGSVAASDTIDRSVMGARGCYLEIINGNAASDTVTITDSGTTPAGNAVGTISSTVTNATSKIFKIYRNQVNTTTGKVTVTNSVTSSVTYKLYPFD